MFRFWYDKEVDAWESAHDSYLDNYPHFPPYQKFGSLRYARRMRVQLHKNFRNKKIGCADLYLYVTAHKVCGLLYERTAENTQDPINEICRKYPYVPLL